MRFHCLGGAGSIGALVSSSLASLPSTKVRLILRRKDAASALLLATPLHLRGDSSTAFSELNYGPLVSLKIERGGLTQRTDGLEIELTGSKEDLERRNLGRTLSPTRSFDPSASTTAASSFSSIPSIHSGLSRVIPFDLVRNDPIDTLIITTKAPQTLPAIHHLIPRLSSSSTILLLQNGMGVLERLLETYWPEDTSAFSLDNSSYYASSSEFGKNTGAGERRPGRPSFICATTTHGAYRKSDGHYVFAGVGDLKFGVVPNAAAVSAIRDLSSSPSSSNPLLNPRSLTAPSLSHHLPLAHPTRTLHNTLSALLDLAPLNPTWLPLPTLQIAQLQKLAVNAAVNTITGVMGVPNGALVGSREAKEVVKGVAQECGEVFAAHLAREEGTWAPSSSPSPSKPPPLSETHPLSPQSLYHYTQQVLFRTSTNISSTLQDLMSTTPSSTSSTFSIHEPTRTEIDYITGYISILGNKYGVRTDRVDLLGRLVKLKEELLRVGEGDQSQNVKSQKRAMEWEKKRGESRDRDARKARERRDEGG